jgi:2-keto-4-pentenoate hydratase/2-oxohepta-3-ene-1,7-dioic acid hydratase in catechol pathway
MKILRFDDDRIGVLKGEDRVVDVSETISYRVEKGPQRVIEEVIEKFDTLRGDFERIAARQAGIPLGEVRLLVPIPRPSKCLGAFLNYLDLPERKASPPPLDFFYKAPELVGPEGTVELLDLPGISHFHAEAELAFVMGPTPKHVSPEEAMSYVFGYVPFFDISARGVIRATRFIAKGQDTFGPCGPWITTRDEVPDPHALHVTSWTNGKVSQDFSTEHMTKRIPDQVAWLSTFVRLQPSDVIATGTYHAGRDLLSDGDVIEIEIERLGRARFVIKRYRPDRGYGKEIEIKEATAGKLPTPADVSKLTKI